MKKHIIIFISSLMFASSLMAQQRNIPAELTAKSHQQHTMMLLGQFELEEGIYSTHAGDIIYAFIDGECRGTASPMAQHNGLIFLSIGENSEQPKAIELMVWLDERQELLPINETFSFAPFKAEGELNAPAILTLGEMVGTEEAFPAGWHIGNPYPNPFAETTAIPYRLDEPAKINIRLYSSQGQLLQEAYEFTENAGPNTFQLQTAKLATGMYLIVFEIITADKSIRRPFAVVKQ